MSRRVRCFAAALLLMPALVAAQATARRLTTVQALRQYPGYYHLQSVLLRGELAEDPVRPLLRSDDRELPLLVENVQTRSGPVEVRGQVIDVGRLEPGDPRLGKYGEGREADRWPRPGEELVLRLTAVAEAEPATTPSVRALTLEPWKFEGQAVTVTGNFRGRNLFGDLPDSPGKGRYDFVLRGAEGAVWVTGLRPRGKGFDLDVDRRLDTDKWLAVTGTVMRARGLVSIAATKLELAKTPDATRGEEEVPPPPPPPAEVVFSSPTEAETDVSSGSSVRVQFSRGLRESTIPGQVRVIYLGAAAGVAAPEFTTSYDPATRALEIKFSSPLQPFRTVKVELLTGLVAFDGGPVLPWSLTFTVGER